MIKINQGPLELLQLFTIAVIFLTISQFTQLHTLALIWQFRLWRWFDSWMLVPRDFCGIPIVLHVHFTVLFNWYHFTDFCKIQIPIIATITSAACKAIAGYKIEPALHYKGKLNQPFANLCQRYILPERSHCWQECPAEVGVPFRHFTFCEIPTHIITPTSYLQGHQGCKIEPASQTECYPTLNSLKTRGSGSGENAQLIFYLLYFFVFQNLQHLFWQKPVTFQKSVINAYVGCTIVV